MEQTLWRETQPTLTSPTTTSLRPFSTLLSLLSNPSTTPSTLSSLYKTLTHLLSLSPPTLAPIPLSLLKTLPLPHPLPFPPQLHSLSSPLLLTLPPISPSLLLSLPFHSSIPSRASFLRNSHHFHLPPHLLLPVLLGFTLDPYPIVRSSALDGLVSLSGSGILVDDLDILEACYFSSVRLLGDSDVDVRVAAVRSVCEWGKLVAASQQEESDKGDWSDAVFLQVCTMIRDMNVEVRLETYAALGKIGIVSEAILLQCLSKKILATVKDKPPLAPCTARPYEIHASNAAGVFLHGLEDEYSEVQIAACISLRALCILSGQFASQAINLLTCVLNDDSVVVRLEALKTLDCMASSCSLKMQETHIDMILGLLSDSSPHVKSRVIKILGTIKLPDLQVSRLTVQGLLQSLDANPQNESEVLQTLFRVGQNHAKFAASIIEGVSNEIHLFGEGKFSIDSPSVAGLLVLAISASLKHDRYSRRIPPRLFSFAAAYFGRIAHAFSDVLDKDSLLAYLSHCGDRCPDADSESASLLAELPTAIGMQEPWIAVMDTVKLIVETVQNLWRLLKSGCITEVLKALRCCKDSLKNTRSGLLEVSGVEAFAFQYIHIVKCLAKIWECLAVLSKPHLPRVSVVHALLEKLDKALLDLRYKFVGLNEEDELFILELQLLSYVLRLSSSSICCKTLQKVSGVIAHVKCLRDAKTVTCSDFVNLLLDLSSKGSFLLSEASCTSLQLEKLRETFILKGFTLTERIRHISSELVVPCFNAEGPLRFIPGLPVGVPLEITLYNVTNEHKLWIRMTLSEDITEFVFLDLGEYGGSEVRQFSFNSPFYRTPKSDTFTLSVSIGMECMSADVHLAKGHGGPKHGLIYLCLQKEVYFVNTSAHHFK